MDEVKAPDSLSERQIMIAKELVNNDLNEGLPQADFCRKHNLSTATLAKWNKDIDFSKYIQDLKGEVISSDELKAYEVVKRHILERVNSANPSDKDIQMYIDNFQYVVKYQQQKQMEKLGIDVKTGKSTNPVDIEERKKSLLHRLKGDNQ